MRKENGFTMLEMIVVVAIIAILALVGIPKIGQMVAGHELRTAKFMVIQQLRNARAEAIGRNVSVDWVVTGLKSQTMIMGGANLTRQELILPRTSGATFQFTGFNAPANTVRFNNRGSIINVPSGTPATITIRDRGKQTSITLTGGTGWIE